MREIKFRAWETRNNKMIYFEEDETGKEDLQLIKEFFIKIEDCYYASEVELMQFTGLKDKNEKEIYEGDILGREGWQNTKPIKWRLPAQFVLPIEFFKWEIIGNKFENPELLCVKKGVSE